MQHELRCVQVPAFSSTIRITITRIRARLAVPQLSKCFTAAQALPSWQKMTLKTKGIGNPQGMKMTFRKQSNETVKQFISTNLLNRESTAG